MMPYFAREQAAQPYKCGGCKRRFIPSNVSCTVQHGPGSCCHAYETEVESKVSRRFGMAALLSEVRGLTLTDVKATKS